MTRSLRSFFALFIITIFCSCAGYAATVVLPKSSSQIASTSQLLASWNTGTTASLSTGWWVNSWGSPAPIYSAPIVSGLNKVYGNNKTSQVIMVASEGGGGGAVHLVYSASFQYGQTYAATVYLRSDSPAKVSVAFRHDAPNYDIFAQKTVTLGNAWTAVTIEGVYPHTNGAGSLRIIPITLNANIYVGKMTLSLIKNNQLVTAFPDTALPPLFSGMLVNKLGVHNNWPSLKTNILRMWDTGTSWSDMETADGTWNFSRADEYVNYATANNAPVLFTLGQTPMWELGNSGVYCSYAKGCNPPLNLNDWRMYVRALVDRYKTVKYWELWNEPDYYGFWNGTPEQLVSLAQIANEEIKSGNSEAILVGPSVTSVNGVAFLDRFLAAGGGAYIGAVSFHSYYSPSSIGLVSIINSIKYVLSEHNLANMPLWNTEGAPVCDIETQNCTTWTPSTTDELDTTFKALFIMAATGIKNFDYYNWEIGSAISNISDQVLYTNLTPAGLSYQATINLLNTAKITDSYFYQGIYVVRFTVGSESEAAIWSTGIGEVVEIPSSWDFTKAVYWQGSTITIPSDHLLSVGAQPMILH